MNTDAQIQIAKSVLVLKHNADHDEKSHGNRGGGGVETAYHGTTTDVVDKILREGIRPQGEEKVAYATVMFEQAEVYAVVRGRSSGLKPVIIELQVPAKEAAEMGRNIGTAFGGPRGFPPEWISGIYEQNEKGKMQRRAIKKSSDSKTMYLVILIDEANK